MDFVLPVRFRSKRVSQKANKTSKSGQDLQADGEIADIRPRTPGQGPNFALELPPFDFSSYHDLPETDDAPLVSANDPLTIRADANAPRTSVGMTELQTLVVWERLQTTWAGKFRDQAVRVDVEVNALNTRSKIEIQLSEEPLFDKPIIRRYNAQ